MSLPTATDLLRLLHVEPDPWQIQVLDGNDRRLLLNCCRQAGKSTVVAFLSLVEALYNPGTLVLLLSRSLRQSTELFRTVADFHRRLGGRFLEGQSRHELRFTHGSRIVSLPCQPDTVRGFSKVHMLVIDEAARVPDDLYRSVRPMLAVSRGRLICLSTPHGKRGFFYDAWAKGGEDWKRIEVLASQIPRITPEFLAEERRSLGSDTYYRQEYECAFEALEGLVYPDLPHCIVRLDTTPPPHNLTTLLPHHRTVVARAAVRYHPNCRPLRPPNGSDPHERTRGQLARRHVPSAAPFSGGRPLLYRPDPPDRALGRPF